MTIDSVRLDRYYSSPSYVDSFGDRETKVFVIPKKNATLKWIVEMEGDNDRICQKHDELP